MQTGDDVKYVSGKVNSEVEASTLKEKMFPRFVTPLPTKGSGGPTFTTTLLSGAAMVILVLLSGTVISLWNQSNDLTYYEKALFKTRAIIERHIDIILELERKTSSMTSQEICSQPLDKGSCGSQDIERWYHHSGSGSCLPFVYGGCEGNLNNFGSSLKCLEACTKDSINDPERKLPGQFKNVAENKDPEETVGTGCDLPMDIGPCRAAIQRYFYDVEDHKCKEFIYGGCDGNANNFATMDECRSRCLSGAARKVCSLPKESGPCRADIQKWYYDNEVKKCSQFSWGGCGGNDNRFDSAEQCEAMCNEGVAPQAKDGSGRPEYCSLVADSGPCRAAISRFYFDAETGVCRNFIYGGCDGNRNNFEDEGECNDACS